MDNSYATGSLCTGAELRACTKYGQALGEASYQAFIDRLPKRPVPPQQLAELRALAAELNQHCQKDG